MLIFKDFAVLVLTGSFLFLFLKVSLCFVKKLYTKFYSLKQNLKSNIAFFQIDSSNFLFLTIEATNLDGSYYQLIYICNFSGTKT